MTPEKAKELLPVMEAYAEGKTVQFMCLFSEGKWMDYWHENTEPAFLRPIYHDRPVEWRVKPAALELWVCPVCKMIFEFEPQYCCTGGALGKIHEETAPVKMREVLP